MMSKRTDEYQKDPKTENQLERLNNELAQLEKQRIQNSQSPDNPVTFIVGAPRSATTLTHQLLADTDCYTYITNFIARFWRAPSLGSELAKALDIYSSDSMSYQSNFGRTQGWSEPHQFNYFWKDWLLYDEDHQMDREIIEENINPTSFLNQLGSIESVEDKPLLFKSLYTGMQVPYLNDTIEDIRVIVTLRHPFYQSQSNLLGRRAYFGTVNEWFSLKPPEYSDIQTLDPYEQVVAQIYFVLSHIESGIEQVSDEHTSITYYETFMNNVHEHLSRFLNMSEINTPNLDHIPNTFEVRNDDRLDQSERDKLMKYVKQYFGPERDYVPFEEYMRLKN